MDYNDANILDRSQIVFHNRSSTDFGLKLLFPFNPPAPQTDRTPQQVPGVDGDRPLGDIKSFRAVDTAINGVIHIPERYEGNWQQLKGDIENWLYGDEDWLKFRDDPEYKYRACVYTQPTFTPVNNERINVTITFHFQPYKIVTGSDHWKTIPSSGIVRNPEPTVVTPDWHLNGQGSFMLKVNDFPYEFDDVDGDLYLLGNEDNAYSKDPKTIQDENILLNNHIRLANNTSPEFLCGDNKDNTVSIETISGTLNKIEFIPRWRRLI